MARFLGTVGADLGKVLRHSMARSTMQNLSARRVGPSSANIFFSSAQPNEAEAEPPKFSIKNASGQRLSGNEFLQAVKDALGKDVPEAEFVPPKSAFDVLLSEYDVLVEENADLNDKYRRSLAETENVRRRGQKQVEDAKVFAIQGFCKDLLEVADILDLAVGSIDAKAIESDGQLKELHKGVTMTKDVLLKTFKKHGLVVRSPEGEKFDPNLHDAVFEVPQEQTKCKPGEIAHVMKVGYYLRDRPIRPAQVGVVKSD